MKKMKKWNDISLNPNSKDVLDFRQAELTKARNSKLIDNRNWYICQLAKGKNVLDIGVVEHQHEASSNASWLHRDIVNVASSCIGIDILEKEVKLLKQEGFNLQVLDVTKNTLLQKFDLVVCGEIIEHVGNPLALFENVCKMLKDDGIFVLSTPNPWYANVVLKNTFRSLPFTESADHVAWFDSGTLCELASRSGLQLDKYSGVKANRTTTIRSKLFFLFSPLLIKIGIKQEFFAKTIVYEFSRTLK